MEGFTIRGMTKLGRKRLLAYLVFATLLLVAVAAATTAWVTGSGWADAVISVQGIVTVTAIAVGGFYAIYKFEIFRDFQPHLTIKQEISHRRIGERYVHISVDARLINSSKVVVHIRNALFRIQQISPFSDADVEKLFSTFTEFSDTEKYLQFPTIMEFKRSWGHDEFVIEPGETESESFEFIVADEFDSVKVTGFFTDQLQVSKERMERGWLAVSVYDINSEVGEIQ